MKKQPNGIALAVQEPSVLLFDAPFPDSLGDDEIEALRMQEPLPPNQSLLLPAEEPNHPETEPYTIHLQ